MRPRSRHLLPELILLGACLGGCSWSWPQIVGRPGEPIFHSGFPLAGGARTDAALCTLSAVGPEAMLLVTPPPALPGPVPLATACQTGAPAGEGWRGRAAALVRVETPAGAAHGYLYPLPGARGLLVAFTGLGMPAAGWVQTRFAELAAARGYATLSMVRDDRARPVDFDPLAEARRGAEAGRRVAEACGYGPPEAIRFAGMSLGGMEALLAAREAHAGGLPVRAAVLDPLLDPVRVSAHLDSFWHTAAVDASQAFFRRILTGRYGEPPSTTFTDLLHRSAARPGGATALARDAPSAWLCGAHRAALAVFLSDDDPVLGNAQADFARACHFPLRRSGAPGHIPFGCRPEMLAELLETLWPAPAGSGLDGGAISAAPPRPRAGPSR